MRILVLLLALILSGCEQHQEEVESKAKSQGKQGQRPQLMPNDPSRLALVITLANGDGIAISTKIDVDLSSAKATITIGPNQTTELFISPESTQNLKNAWTQAQSDTAKPGPWPSDSFPVYYRLEIDGEFYGEYPGDVLNQEDLGSIENLMKNVYRLVPPKIGAHIEKSFLEQTTQSLQREPVNVLIRRIQRWSSDRPVSE